MPGHGNGTNGARYAGLAENPADLLVQALIEIGKVRVAV